MTARRGFSDDGRAGGDLTVEVAPNLVEITVPTLVTHDS
jgi:hypothetical protein